MTRICTYNRCLDHILMPQGQEHSWLERVAHVAIRVHHTKYTITHTHTHTYIMHNGFTHSKKIKQTLPTFQGYGPTRYKKCKTYIVISRECSPSKKQEKNGTRKGGTLIHALKKRPREREKRKPLGRG